MSIITMNGKQFAKGSAGLVNSLFTGGGTASGYYKIRKNDIGFFSPDGREVAVINRKGGYGRCDKLPDGRKWYSYGTPDIIGQFPSYSAEREAILSAMKVAGF